MAVPAARVESLEEALRSRGVLSARIGEIVADDTIAVVS
jgi:hypothetical protein